MLLAEPGVTKNRDEIIEHAWNDRVVASGSLNQAIFSLRNSLNDGRDHEIVMTVPRRGYQFNQNHIIDLQAELATPPESQQPTPTDDVEISAPVAPDDIDVPANPAVPSQKKPGFIINKLFIGYAMTVALCVATLMHLGLPFKKTDVKVVHTKLYDLTLNTVGNSLDEARALNERLSQQLDKLAANLQGQVWISQSKTNYTLACIRADQSTRNYQFNSQAKELPAMIQQCLEAAL
ncbi:DNA-binding transcriptional activator CadC [compost metagenome]